MWCAAANSSDLPQQTRTPLLIAQALLFQPPLLWWALFAAGVINWPFRRR
jgi:hypothetical protein